MDRKLKDYLEGVKGYIEDSEYNVDGEWGSGRSINEIIMDGDMPALYQDTLDRLYLLNRQIEVSDSGMNSLTEEDIRRMVLGFISDIVVRSFDLNNGREIYVIEATALDDEFKILKEYGTQYDVKITPQATPKDKPETEDKAAQAQEEAEPKHPRFPEKGWLSSPES